MILQVINLMLSVVLMLEVLFLFTCGQRYMKLSILRNRRNFVIERWTYLFIGVLGFVNGMLNPGPQPTELLLIAAVAFLLFRKCMSANNHYKHVKAINNGD